MKKTGITLILLLMMVVVGVAQPGQRSFSPEDMARRQTEQVKEAVGLNEKQEKQVYELNLESSKKMRSMREEMQGEGFEAMRERMAEIREEQDKKMKAVLTGEQWKKYEKFREERQARWNERRRRP